MSTRFEWDPRKAQRNRVKHRVSFDEAATIFGDLRGLMIHDPDHSLSEDRFITVGRSSRNRILTVAHTDRGDTIRIISARRATAKEREQYAEND